MLVSPNRRRKRSHIWDREPNGWYVEPRWTSRRLFAVEQFIGSVWDPCCGLKHIIESARQAGYDAAGADLVDRGDPSIEIADFLSADRRVDNIVFNPPYDRAQELTQHALKLAIRKVAMFWLLRRVPAARWLRTLPLARIHLLSPRPSCPPGPYILAGGKPEGATDECVWLVFEHGYVGPVTTSWLLRDEEERHG